MDVKQLALRINSLKEQLKGATTKEERWRISIELKRAQEIIENRSAFSTRWSKELSKSSNSDIRNMANVSLESLKAIWMKEKLLENPYYNCDDTTLLHDFTVPMELLSEDTVLLEDSNNDRLESQLRVLTRLLEEWALERPKNEDENNSDYLKRFPEHLRVQCGDLFTVKGHTYAALINMFGDDLKQTALWELITRDEEMVAKALKQNAYSNFEFVSEDVWNESLLLTLVTVAPSLLARFITRDEDGDLDLSSGIHPVYPVGWVVMAAKKVPKILFKMMVVYDIQGLCDCQTAEDTYVACIENDPFLFFQPGSTGRGHETCTPLMFKTCADKKPLHAVKACKRTIAGSYWNEPNKDDMSPRDMMLYALQSALNKQDKNQMFEIVQYCTAALLTDSNLDDDLDDDLEVVVFWAKVVSLPGFGCSLQYAPLKARMDVDVCIAALKSDASAYVYVADDLKGNYRMVMYACGPTSDSNFLHPFDAAFSAAKWRIDHINGLHECAKGAHEKFTAMLEPGTELHSSKRRKLNMLKKEIEANATKSKNVMEMCEDSLEKIGNDAEEIKNSNDAAFDSMQKIIGSIWDQGGVLHVLYEEKEGMMKDGQFVGVGSAKSDGLE